MFNWVVLKMLFRLGDKLVVEEDVFEGILIYEWIVDVLLVMWYYNDIEL